MDDAATLTNSFGYSPGSSDGLPAGTVIASRYELRRLIGAGASAHVYEAFDRHLRQSIAIKILRAERTSDAEMKRFRREVVAAREASSPHLLRLYDLAETDGCVYVTMELADGGSVSELLRGGPLPVERALEISAQLLDALGALHRAGVVHRDVKPSNVLLMRDGSVKLGDFGLVHRLNAEESVLTADDALVGTWGYLSPEQAMGREVTPRSDLYSFGAVLYELLIGARLFEGEFTVAEVVSRVLRRPPGVRTIRPEVPPWLERVVGRLLEREPRDRYASAAEALRDITRRRSSVNLRRSARIAAVAMIAAAGFAAFLWSRHRAAEFDHLADQGGNSVTAYARDGRILWRRAHLTERVTASARMPGGRILIATVPFLAGTTDLEMQFLDPQSGAIVKRVSLPSGATLFPSYAAEYGAAVVAADDIDGRGVDRIFVMFGHYHYWPSFIDVFDPATDRARTLFAGSGHHRIVGFADVNGDGRREIILCGPNNLMGWFTAVTAIPFPANQTDVPAFSPDEDRTEGPNSALWYALVRRGFTNSAHAMTDDPRRRVLTIALSGGDPVRIGYDGFLVGSGTKSPALREAARERAYSHLRDSQRLSRRGLLKESLQMASDAAAEAATAQEPILEQWCRRVEGKVLIDLGRYDEAESVFEKLSSETAASDSSYDAAREFHRRGEIERAIRWYRRGLGPGGSASAGRLKYEFLEGEALALGALGRWSEVLHEIEVFRESYPAILSPGDELAAFARWRVTGEFPPQRQVKATTSTDLQRYWMLELSYQAHDDPAALLRTVEEELPRVSGSDVLVRSIKAGLLDRLGRRAEALPLARSTWQEARRMTDDPVVRANLDLVEGRYRAVAR